MDSSRQKIASHETEKSVLKFNHWTMLTAAFVALVFIFFDSLVEMEYRWSTLEQYSHGYMIPLVSLFLIWQKSAELKLIDWQPAWSSVPLMILALLGWALGELSALYIIVHYSMLVALFALFLAATGWQGARISGPALVYLIFMVPLPIFILRGLSAQLQLISTELGVAVIRMFDITVFSEGNVIDLGVYQLQVVEACSGLNYLFPLMSFGYLIAVLYRGPIWHRWVIFLATIPITVLMNSVRIGIIGITVDYWGIEAAEGVLHSFEGWFVFMACLALLALLILMLNLNSHDGAGVLSRIHLDYPSMKDLREVPQGCRNSSRVLVLVMALCVVAAPASMMLSDREEVKPDRQLFAKFPLLKGDWVGSENEIEERILDKLLLTDYILADYHVKGDPYPVNFYVAYYDSQRTGASIHSPRSCIPGGGWEITALSEIDLSNVMGLDAPRVNRAIIKLGEQRQLIYYWFQQRGRIVTNEYMAKWYLFQDSLTTARTDGALVRLVTPLESAADESVAEARLHSFLREFYHELPTYVPGGIGDK